MKRLLCVLLVLALLCPLTVAAAEPSVTALTAGYQDVLFSNGYRGFCLDRDLHGATGGNGFSTAAAGTATSNYDASNISQALKILFTQHFETIFISDGNGGYQLANTNTIQGVIWHLTDNQYVWGEQKTLLQAIQSYTGPAIPDNGYTRTLSTGEQITFYFMVLEAEAEDVQDFFGYKFTVSTPPSHTHDFSDDWKHDDTNHWRECECGEKEDSAAHSGGSADCENPAVCEECGQPYGTTDPKNHTGNTELRGYLQATTEAPGYTGDVHCADCGALLTTGQPIPQLHKHDFSDDWKHDDTNHWRECECGEKEDIEEHTYQDGFCIFCQVVDPTPPTTPPGSGSGGVTPGAPTPGTPAPVTPNTGDTGAIVLWASVCALSAAAWLGLYIHKRKLSQV